MVLGTLLGLRSSAVSNVNPARSNKRQRAGTHNHPEHKCLEKWAKANLFQRVLIESGANQKQRHRKSNPPHVIESQKRWPDRR